MAKIWEPWKGCHKIGEGCKNCYIHMGDKRKGIDTDVIYKTEKYDLPIQKKKNGDYRIPSGELIYVCFSSDFLLEESDGWRAECFQMIKKRSDLHFIFLTKRIDRFMNLVPIDWEDGYDNVTVGVSASTQKEVDSNIRILNEAKIKHKNVILQPLIEKIDISNKLEGIELVVVGGEYGVDARPLDYDWVLNVREQCVEYSVPFEFRQCGTYFLKDCKEYKLTYKELTVQAKKANINWDSKE